MLTPKSILSQVQEGDWFIMPSPLDIRAHSTRGVASSTALFRGVPLEDICMAAGWSSPHTFVKFYNLDVNTAPGSQVLSA